MRDIVLSILQILGWPKRSFGFFHKMLPQNPNELFGQPNNSLFNPSKNAYEVGTFILPILQTRKVRHREVK